MLKIGDICSTINETPIFNTPHIHHLFGGEKENEIILDAQGLFRDLEVILFPEEIIVIKEIFQNNVYRVSTTVYEGTELYLDGRFLLKIDAPSVKSSKHLPSSIKCSEQLKSLTDHPYLWGGNLPKGIEKMRELYPSKGPLNEQMQRIWSLIGFDCSGLLYYVTNGITPRNTSQLIEYGQHVDILDKKIDGIIQAVRPLDIIVWKGHVVIILDRENCIESVVSSGVITSSLKERLEKITETKKAAKVIKSPEEFVIRRWHPDFLEKDDKKEDHSGIFEFPKE
ncbi:MAG: NlpC/P60 family protein [Rhabdochlamydiaceae bacterium]